MPQTLPNPDSNPNPSMVPGFNLICPCCSHQVGSIDDLREHLTTEHQIASSQLPNVLMKGLQPSSVDVTTKLEESLGQEEHAEQSEDDKAQKNVVRTMRAFLGRNWTGIFAEVADLIWFN